ncbi:MAG: S8 family serine peptidase [Cyanobacteriota bacterium]
MSKIPNFLTNLSDQGSSQSSSNYHDLLLSQNITVPSGTKVSPTLQTADVAASPLAGATTTPTSALSTDPTTSSGTPKTLDDSTPSGPVPTARITTFSVVPLEQPVSPAPGAGAPTTAPATPSLPFDGLLVNWNPLSTAQERANARAALGLGLTETIHTRAMQSNGAGAIEWVSLPTGLSAEQAIAALARRPGVAYAEKNWLLQTQATSNDPGVTNGSLWGMYGDGSSPANTFGSQAAEAWTRGFTGSGNVYVGIIDEGYQYNHSDLSGNAGVNPGEIAGNGIDDDGNSYVDDVQGWDFVGNNNTIYDDTGDDHGTHVAGTIGGQGGNGIGVAGLNWDVSLLSGKFLGASGGSTANAIKAVDYFTDLKTRHGLNLVATNNSWGGGGYSQGLYDAISRANAAKIFFVAAAGNSSTSTLSYPAGYDLPNVISVASLDSNGNLSGFSNFGSTWVDLAAPGGGLYSTLPDNTYGTYSGTSMAAPHVTGGLALMAAAQPTATMAQLKQALMESVVATSSLASKTATGGRLNVDGAITRLSQLVTPVDPNAPAVTGPASVNEGSALNLTITNLIAGTTPYWKLSGTGISNTDFSGLNGLQGGPLTADANGTASFQATVADDQSTEGNESLLFEVFSDANLTTRLTGTTVILNDTSKSTGVILWGNTNTNNLSDTITGSGGPDRLAGVRSTGSSAADLGASQIDTLTGMTDADVFLLGDSRGVFYDNRVAGNLGIDDYALIKDFVSGSDKLQVRAGMSYLYTIGASGLSLYWDRNGNGSLNSSGKNQDELIAILQGVSAITGTDLIAV